MPSGFLGRGIGPSAFGGGGLAAPVPVVGAELLTDGAFDAEAGWNMPANGAWAITGGKAIGTNIPDFAAPFRVVTSTQYDWFAIGTDLLAMSVGTFAVGFRGITSAALIAPISGVRFFVTGRGDTANNNFYPIPYPTFTGEFDNASVKALALASLLSTRNYASANCDLSAGITRTAGTQAGFVARLDSSTSPANFIISYLDGAGNLKTDTCIAGVYANVAGLSGAVTYVAGQRPRLVCSGTSVSVYYNGTQVGSTTTVDNAALNGNTRHGLFSTYASNSFAGFVAA